jgi:predicted component of type VI protein secretion system
VKQALIGSSRDSCIVIPGDGVEPIHARILFDRGGYFLEDLSGGATRVNGRPLNRNRLHHLNVGDEVRLGSVELRFEAAESSIVAR